jgi:hypothetical protein
MVDKEIKIRFTTYCSGITLSAILYLVDINYKS